MKSALVMNYIFMLILNYRKLLFMFNVMSPKDLARLARSTERALQRCEQALKRMQNVPRWSPDPELVKKYNLIEFL